MMMSANILPDRPRPPFLGGPWMMTLLFAVISVTLLGLWAARALTAPLSSFARAAESFSLNGAAAPLPERGPEEIRFVARALNRMRERITGLIDDRTKMLAAISHDLRTPITRMRLRAEFIEDEIYRSRMLDDLDQMRSMLKSVLSFLRNGSRLETMTLADVAARCNSSPTSSPTSDARSPMTAPRMPWPRCSPTICTAPSPIWWRMPSGSGPKR